MTFCLLEEIKKYQQSVMLEPLLFFTGLLLVLLLPPSAHRELLQPRLDESIRSLQGMKQGVDHWYERGFLANIFLDEISNERILSWLPSCDKTPL